MILDRQTAALLEQLNSHAARSSEDTSISEARLGATALFAAFAGEAPSVCKTEDRCIDGPHGEIPVRCYWPEKQGDEQRSIIVFFHGGGWSMGDVASYDSFIRSICVLSRSILISVDYRLAPEHQFPVGLEDSCAVTRWVLHHGAEIKGDVKRVAVMGDSAGGNLAAVIAHRIQSGEGPHLAAQFLLYPVLDVISPHSRYPSRMNFGNGDYLLSREGIDVATHWYLGGRRAIDPAEISPLQEENLQGMPPTVIMVGGFDPLLDEAKAYRARLEAAGVPTDFKCYESAIHAFLSFGILDIAVEGRKYLAEKIQDLLKN